MMCCDTLDLNGEFRLRNSPVNLSEYSSGSYNPGSLFRRVVWYFCSLFIFETGIPIPSRVKAFVLRIIGAKIGRGVVIKPSVKIKYPWFLEVGDYVWIGERVWIDNLVTVRLGDNVCISQQAYLLTGNHNYKDSRFGLMAAGINVESGVWIGASAIVCPGVNVGRGAVLCVGSVAVSNLAEMGIYQGNPAGFVRERRVK